MDKFDIQRLADAFTRDSELNLLRSDVAFRPELAGMRFADEPLIGYAAADDDYLLSLRHNQAANLNMEMPEFWLASAETVISLFIPYTEQIRISNRGGEVASDEWLHGRIEGEEFGKGLAFHIADALKAEGYDALIPYLDERIKSKGPAKPPEVAFTSNWSERHVAYAAGLGTFGLQKGLITKKGVCGRFISIVTSLPLLPDEREYSGITDYCIMCGKCAENCPAHAISLETGKDHMPCAKILGISKAKRPPYYGCGKCMVDVPCEIANPSK
jgi:epoxyqueuosine reductase QueG